LITTKIGSNSSNKKLLFLVLSFFLVVNIASGGGHFDWVDGVEAFLVTESMVLKHSAMVYPDDPSIQKLHYAIGYLMPINKALQTGKPYNPNIRIEPVYLIRSLLLSAIAVPFYYAAIFFSVSPISFVAIFVNSLLISLICVVIFFFSLEIYRSKKIAFILSLIFGVCSFVWPYHTTLWSQPLQALCLVAAAYFIYLSLHRHSSFICHYMRENSNISSNRNSKSNSNNNNSNTVVDSYYNYKKDTTKGIYLAGLGGLFLGLSVFAHPNSLILIPGFIVYSIVFMRHNKRTLISFLIVTGIVLLFMGFVNYWRFGSFTQFGYGYFESLSLHSGWIGLVGLLASPGAGIIFYFPIVILLPLSFIYMYKQNKGLFFLSTYIILSTWLYIGTLSYWEPLAWSGGVAWGPRYLIPVLPFITLVSGAIIVNLKRMNFKRRLLLKLSVILLCIAGFSVNLLGTLVWFMYDIVYAWQREGLATSSDWPIIMTWNIHSSPIILHIKMLTENYVSNIQPQKYANTSWYWLSYGLAPCPYDTYVLCKLGPVPMLFLLGGIATLAIFVMKEIRFGSSPKRGSQFNLFFYSAIKKFTSGK
jgi:hypothetical protein